MIHAFPSEALVVTPWRACVSWVKLITIFGPWQNGNFFKRSFLALVIVMFHCVRSLESVYYSIYTSGIIKPVSTAGVDGSYVTGKRIHMYSCNGVLH